MASKINTTYVVNSSLVNFTTNDTASLVFQLTGPTWTPLTVFYVLSILLAFLHNGVVLLVFFYQRSLITTFNIYLINLLLANLLNVMLNHVPDVFNRLYNGWWLGDAYCSVMIFGLYLLEAGIQNCHILIAINRIWAVFWPFSYRTHHRKRTAVLFCCLGWLEMLAWLLPGYILDAAYYRSDPLSTGGCYLNIPAQWNWAAVVQFLTYDMGLIQMWLAYPMIWWRRRRILRVGQMPMEMEISGGAPAIVVGPCGEPVGPGTPQEQNGSLVTVSSRRGFRPGRPQLFGAGGKRASSRGFFILTLLTISVTVSWTPVNALYTVMLWVDLDDALAVWLLEIAAVLFVLQMALDPIFFVCALPNLRDAFRRLLMPRRCL